MVEIPNAFANCRKLLLDQLKEAAPGRIQLLTGPRQVGKTTLLLEIAVDRTRTWDTMTGCERH